jgi:hypothetical protein
MPSRPRKTEPEPNDETYQPPGLEESVDLLSRKPADLVPSVDRFEAAAVAIQHRLAVAEPTSVDQLLVRQSTRTTLHVYDTLRRHRHHKDADRLVAWSDLGSRLLEELATPWDLANFETSSSLEELIATVPYTRVGQNPLDMASLNPEDVNALSGMVGEVLKGNQSIRRRQSPRRAPALCDVLDDIDELVATKEWDMAVQIATLVAVPMLLTRGHKWTSPQRRSSPEVTDLQGPLWTSASDNWHL